MEYICKCCENKVTAESFDDIIRLNKLCKICFDLDEGGRKVIRKTMYGKKNTFEKENISRNRNTKKCKHKIKGKKLRKFTFICSYCGTDSKCDYKPFSCSSDSCSERKGRSNTFFRKEITRYLNIFNYILFN